MIHPNTRLYIIKIYTSLIFEIIKIDKNSICMEMALIEQSIIILL